MKRQSLHTSDSPSGQSPTSDISRREMLERMLLVSAAGMLPTTLLTSCRKRPDSESALDDGDFNPPFSTWRTLQKLVRQSPDHLVARAEALVEAGDARAILDFIGNDLRVIPGGERSWLDPLNMMRWGTRAVLRSGKGTARELAELAVELLGQIGVSAQVRGVSADSMPADQIAAILAPRPEVGFALPWTSADRIALTKQLVGPRAAGPLPTQPQIQAEAQNLVREILDRFDGGAAKDAKPFSASLPALPVVEVELPGADPQIVFPSLPGAPSVPSGSLSTFSVGEPSKPWQVKVRLLAATTRAPKSLEELVAKTWAAPEIIGNQVAIRCLPNLTHEEAAVVSIGGVRTFTPILAVQGPRLSREQAVSLSTAGEPVTVSGERIAVDSLDRLEIDGITIVPPGEADDAAANSVTALDLEIDARAFPELIVHATPRNKDGALVSGLPAANFAILDHDKASPFLLMANQPSPRIVLLVDESRSMPPEYHGAGAGKILDGLSELVKTQFPTARLQMLLTDSDIWRWLDVAQSERPDLVIYITDGDQDGTVTEETLTRLRQSGPTLFIDAVGDDPSRFKPFVETTGGDQIAASSAAEALAHIARRLSSFAMPPYRFSLSATGTTPKKRSLRVSLLSAGKPTGVSAEIDYEAPDSTQRLSPPGICTLAVEVELTRHYASTITVRRIIAGCDPDSDIPPTPDDLHSVRNALFGHHLLHVEGGGTTEAIRIDDLLEGQLGMESLIKAASKGEELQPHLDRGDNVVPAELLALTGRIRDPDGASLVYEEGMRMVLFGLVPQLGTDRLKRRVDVLPTAAFSSASENSTEAFLSTARATAQLAVLESKLFPESTLSSLRNKRLVPDPGDPQAVGLAHGDAWNRLRSMIRNSGAAHQSQRFLIPEGGGGAAWMLNPASGELFGMFNGAGGAEIMEQIKKQTEEFDAVITVYGMIFDQMRSLAGVPAAGGIALAVVAEYSKTLVKLYAAVSYVLIHMRAEDLDDAIREILLEFAVNAAKQFFPSTFDDEKIAEDLSAIITVCYMASGKKRQDGSE
jgi:hypothetical protein